MDESATRLLQRIVRRIPTRMLKATLEKWDRLTAEQRLSVDFIEPKWELVQKLVSICEVSFTHTTWYSLYFKPCVLKCQTSARSSR